MTPLTEQVLDAIQMQAEQCSEAPEIGTTCVPPSVVLRLVAEVRALRAELAAAVAWNQRLTSLLPEHLRGKE